MPVRAQLVSIVFAALVFLGVFELVRRRYLTERYALLWLAASVALFVLAVWKGLLTTISHAAGIKTPSNGFFVIAFAFLLLLVVHFSVVVSQMSDKIATLAQRLALVESRERAAGTDDRPSVESEIDGEAQADAAEERARV